jgi:hypothetical protein
MKSNATDFEEDLLLNLTQQDLDLIFASETKSVTKLKPIMNKQHNNMPGKENINQNRFNNIDVSLFDNILNKSSLNVQSSIETPSKLDNIDIDFINNLSSCKSKKSRISLEMDGDVDLTGIDYNILSDLISEPKQEYNFPTYMSDYFTVKKMSHNNILIARFLDVNKRDLDVDVLVKLYYPWNELEFRENDVIYLNAKFNHQIGCYEVQDEHYIDKELEAKGKILYSYIIVHPEMLLTPTTIKNSFPCPRKGYFEKEYLLLFRIPLTLEMLIGIVAHNVLEDLFNDQIGQIDIDKQIDITTIMQKVQKFKNIHIFDLAMIKSIEPEEIELKFNDLAGKIFHFWTNTFKNFNCVVQNGIITKILASERKIFNSELGIKGVIDFEVSYAKGGKMNNQIHIAGEIKSGVEKCEDERQLSLYCMMLTKENEDTKGSFNNSNEYFYQNFEDIKYGFLLYLKSGKCSLREFKRFYCVYLLKSRNEVAILLRVN